MSSSTTKGREGLNLFCVVSEEIRHWDLAWESWASFPHV